MSRKRPGCLVNVILIGGLMALLAVTGGLIYYLLKEDASDPIATAPPIKATPGTSPSSKPSPSPTPPEIKPPANPPTPPVAPETKTKPEATAATKPTAPPAPPAPPRPPDESKPAVVQDQTQFQEFQSEVTKRIEEADDDKFDTEMKETARSVVRKLSGLIKVMTVRFESGAELSSEYQLMLEATLLDPKVKAALANQESGFIVLGFADSSGTAADNKRLSKDRAEAVRKYLKDGAGITHKTYAFGLGVSTTLSDDPVKNRAAEIWLAIPGENP